MAASTGAPTTCPRGCGRTGAPHHIASHARKCFTPRTHERLAEIGSVVTTPDGCQLWNGNAERRGIIGRRYAYVVACLLAHGPAPTGKPFALHSCDQPGCIAPEHLRWGTQSENMTDAVERGRARGLFEPGNFPARWL